MAASWSLRPKAAMNCVTTSLASMAWAPPGRTDASKPELARPTYMRTSGPESEWRRRSAGDLAQGRVDLVLVEHEVEPLDDRPASVRDPQARLECHVIGAHGRC